MGINKVFGSGTRFAPDPYLPFQKILNSVLYVSEFLIILTLKVPSI
jgi:hypothetical protein